MAGESRLRDARIKVVIDVGDALNDIPRPGSEPGSPGTPGSTPSVPGQRPPPGGGGDDGINVPGRRPGGRRPDRKRVRRKFIPRSISGAITTAGLVSTITILADSLPGMIDKRIEQLDVTDVAERATLEFLQKYIANPASVASKVVSTARTPVAFIGAAVPAALEVAKSNQILGLGMDGGTVADLAIRQGRMAAASSSLGGERRRLGTQALGGELLDILDRSGLVQSVQNSMRDLLFGGTATSR